jgi:hypothetical protein
MIELSALFLLIPLGYLSGGGWKSGLFSPVIGVVFGVLFGAVGWWLVAFAIAAWLSEMVSPAKYCTGVITDGAILTADGAERGRAWFETDYLCNRPYLGVAVRGLIGVVPYIPIVIVAPVWLILVQAIAFPLALYIGTKLPISAWTFAETARYFIVGCFICLIN